MRSLRNRLFAGARRQKRRRFASRLTETAPTSAAWRLSSWRAARPTPQKCALSVPKFARPAAMNAPSTKMSTASVAQSLATSALRNAERWQSHNSLHERPGSSLTLAANPSPLEAIEARMSSSATYSSAVPTASLVRAAQPTSRHGLPAARASPASRAPTMRGCTTWPRPTSDASDIRGRLRQPSSDTSRNSAEELARWAGRARDYRAE
jgi:hypothetical protein